ncbi:3-oxoacyl-ACP synthase [Neisseria meningitidis]|nr:3-oxoacyl-ACP synthase [Neisseria meningitidis]
MDWHERFPELEAQLGAPIEDYAPPKHWTRKQLRSMGRVSYLCVDAAEQALTDAGLLGDESITDGRMGVACGSSSGSTKDIGMRFLRALSSRTKAISADGVKADVVAVRQEKWLSSAF